MRFVGVLLALAVTIPLQAKPDWPDFRGPGGEGHASESEVPLRWSQSQNVRWKINVPGEGWSSPIAKGDYFWVTTAIENGGKTDFVAKCFRLKDGSEVWSQSLFSADTPAKHKKNSYASPSPLLVGRQVIAHFGPYGTAAVDAITGKVNWKQTSIVYKPVHGNGGSPVAGDDRIFFSCDGAADPFVVSLSLADGSILWRTPRKVEVSRKFSFSTPLRLPQQAGEPRLVAVPGSGAVIAYEEATGKEVWRFDYDEGYSVVPRPVLHEDILYACSGFNRASLFAIKLGGKGDITESHLAWKNDKAIPKESSPIIVEGLLYLNDDKGVLSCFDAKTGEEIYRERLSGTGNYSASPVYASGHLFFHSENGQTTVVKPGKEFTVTATNDLDSYGLSSFGVLDDGFLIRTENEIYRVGE